MIEIRHATPVDTEHEVTEFIEIKECLDAKEFIDFADSLWNKGSQMIVYHDDSFCYAYLEDSKELYYCYLSKEQLEDESKSSDQEKAKIRDINKSGYFSGLLAVLMTISLLFPAGIPKAAGYVSGEITNDTTQYPGLSSVQFYVGGDKRQIPVKLGSVKTENYETTGYTFGDPRVASNQESISLESLAEGANEDFIFFLLSYSQMFSPAEITKTTGLQVTDKQVKAATQVAVWTYASTVQLDYQVDVNSVTDPTVRSLATSITSWANGQLKNLSVDGTAAEQLFPVLDPQLQTSNASMKKTDAQVSFGPYTIEGQAGVNYIPTIEGGILNNSAGKKIDSVTSGQQFFVVYPATYGGNQLVQFTAKQFEYSLAYGNNRVWIDKQPKEAELKFQLNAAVGSKGTIELNITDKLTGEKVPSVGVVFSNSSPIDTITSDSNGKIQFNGEVGEYTLSFSVPGKYLKPEDLTTKIGFAGDIKILNIELGLSEGVTNFYAVDSQTLAPAGDSEAFIYDSNNKPVKRIALKGGVAKGIALPVGTYTLVQYKTSNGYAVNTGVQFESTAGNISDISVPQLANVKATKITIADADTDKAWIYTVSMDQKTLFQMKSYNVLTLSLPQGEYTVTAKKEDGSASTESKKFFPVGSSDTLVVIEQEIGTETLNLTYLDTVENKPIPGVTVGLMDENHVLITSKTTGDDGKVSFQNVTKFKIYFLNVLAAPPEVSGYSADGNRLLGSTKDISLHLYSLEEVQAITKQDTIFRVANVSYSGSGYQYPKVQQVTEEKPKRKKFLGIF